VFNVRLNARADDGTGQAMVVLSDAMAVAALRWTRAQVVALVNVLASGAVGGELSYKRQSGFALDGIGTGDRELSDSDRLVLEDVTETVRAMEFGRRLAMRAHPVYLPHSLMHRLVPRLARASSLGQVLGSNSSAGLGSSHKQEATTQSGLHGVTLKLPGSLNSEFITTCRPELWLQATACAPATGRSEAQQLLAQFSHSLL